MISKDYQKHQLYNPQTEIERQNLNNKSLNEETSNKKQQDITTGIREIGKQYRIQRQKLDALRKQVELKKKEKQLTKQTMATEQDGSRNSRRTNHLEKHDNLVAWLEKFKMEHLVSKLKEKNVNTVEDLKNVHPDVVDQWKDIPVGYRIKLKKQLHQIQTSPKISRSPIRSISPPSRIEQIITRRKKNRVFQPLRESQYDDSNDQQLTEYQQEQMIKQLMTVFNKEEQIQQIQLSAIEKPSVVMHTQEAWEERGGMPNKKYCWACLKKVQGDGIGEVNNRVFCGDGCLMKYQNALKVEDDEQFFNEIQKTEGMFRSYLQMRLSSKGPRKNTHTKAELDDDEVDLAIE